VAERAGLAAAEEEALQDRQDLFAGEGLHAFGRAVVLEHTCVVFERAVGCLQCVAELVTLEEIIVSVRLVAASVLRVDGAADRPDATLLPLDPDHDAFVPPGVVDSAEQALSATTIGRLATHERRIQSPAMAFPNPFSFLFQRSSAEERVAAYVIREHDRGRNLAEILEDRYVQNRLGPQQIARLLDRPEVIKAIGNDTIADARHAIEV
jgi:hypothetical protein